MELFSVAVFYANDTWEYVRRDVPPKEACEAAALHTQTVGARMGMVVRVVITDDDDGTCFEWKFGQGVTFGFQADEAPPINTAPAAPVDGQHWYDTDAMAVRVWRAATGTWNLVSEERKAR